ncbi:hypothetical protein STEG23_036500, partial [Scotinomys teguina]
MPDAKAMYERKGDFKASQADHEGQPSQLTVLLKMPRGPMQGKLSSQDTFHFLMFSTDIRDHQTTLTAELQVITVFLLNERKISILPTGLKFPRRSAPDNMDEQLLTLTVGQQKSAMDSEQPPCLHLHEIPQPQSGTNSLDSRSCGPVEIWQERPWTARKRALD